MRTVKDPFSTSLLLWVPLVLFCFLAAHGIGSYMASDDFQYLRQASGFARQVPLAERTVDSTSGRIMVWLPTSAVSLLGSSVYSSSVIATFLFAFALVVMVAFFWRPQYEQRICIIAAAMLATNPLFLKYSTRIYPAVYLTAFMVMAMIQYQRCSSRKGDNFCWVFVGIWIGLATLAKPTGVLLFPILVVHRGYVVSRKGSLRAGVQSILGMGLGGLIVFLLSTAFMAWWLHNPWHLFKVLGETGSAFRKAPWYESYTADRFGYIRLLVSRDFAWIGLFFVAAAIVSCFGRGGPKLEATTGLAYLGYLMFGSVSLTQYTRPTQWPRYIVPCIPFFAMCAAYQVSRILNAWRRYWTEHRTLIGASMSRFGWVTLCLFLAFSAILAIDQVTHPYPLKLQLSFIRGAICDVGSPTFVTARFKRGYAPVLTDKELEALQVFSDEKPVPSRYTLLLGWFDWRGLGDRPAWQTPMPWQHATFTKPDFVMSWPRRLMDRLRKRNRAWYEDHLIWYGYHNHLYRVDFDTNSPRRTGSSSPPWERDGAYF
jgi:hypothetical protein